VAQVFSPPAKANGQLLREYQLDSAQLSYPCERFGAAHQHKHFLTLRCLVNKTTAVLLISTCTHLSSSITSPYHIHPLFDTIYEPNHSIVHFFVDAPPPFCLVAAPGTFSARAYSGRLCEQGITLNTHFQYVVSYEIHWGAVRKLTLSVSGIFGYINYLVEKDRKFILDTLVNGQPPLLGRIQLSHKDCMLTLSGCRSVTSRVSRI
jgi:hypothetical protein